MANINKNIESPSSSSDEDDYLMVDRPDDILTGFDENEYMDIDMEDGMWDFSEDSTTEDSTTEGSTTEDNTTEDSTTEDSATEDSATEDSATEDSATEDSATEDSATEDSATQTNDIDFEGEKVKLNVYIVTIRRKEEITADDECSSKLEIEQAVNLIKEKEIQLTGRKGSQDLRRALVVVNIFRS
ncbi:hypothetical protein M434DRAFT_15085 [Hypoxylon sp. CO27-5]|nr:hypothetical protein M434DRAFT_15085 [Hypoxylon sp. CO27-5]